MIRAVDIKAELAGLPVLRERRVNTPADEVGAAFATLAPFRDGSVFAGRFSGDTPWERHRKGDELVQILDGAATLTIMTDEGAPVVRAPRGHADRRPAGALAPVRGARRRHGAERDAAAHRAHRGSGSEGRSLASLGAYDGQADQA